MLSVLSLFFTFLISILLLWMVVRNEFESEFRRSPPDYRFPSKVLKIVLVFIFLLLATGLAHA